MKARDKLILPREKYLSAGVHIGMTSKTADMKRFVYKVRPSGLAVLNIGLLDRRIDYAAAMLVGAQRILAVSYKEAGQEPARKFAEATNAHAIVGRFMPGSLTNPSFERFFEPDIMLVTDPASDKQAIREAVKCRIPIIGFADTSNETSYLDLVLPCNNKGKKSLTLMYWLLAKLVVEKRGGTFELTPEDFGYEPEKKEDQESRTR